MGLSSHSISDFDGKDSANRTQSSSLELLRCSLFSLFSTTKLETKKVTHFTKKYVTNKFPNAGTNYRINSRRFAYAALKIFKKRFPTLILRLASVVSQSMNVQSGKVPVNVFCFLLMLSSDGSLSMCKSLRYAISELGV